jgi:excinuclease UvrABC ATPase subunit
MKKGELYITGTPEQVAKNTVSYTAQYLRGGVGKKKRRS